MLTSFLQTDRWAQFQNTLGRRTFFVSGVGWRALLIQHALPLGFNYLYCPRGPVFGHVTCNVKRETSFIKDFLQKARSVADQERSIFLRWDPPFLETEFDLKTFQVSGFKFQDVRPVQPRINAVLNLSKSEKELLAAMHEKTRYNIRLAERKGVTVWEEGAERGPEIFWRLLMETARRDKFATHPKAHYEKLVGMFCGRREEPLGRLYFAGPNREPLAAAFVMFYAGTATYLHGASASEHRELMAPYALHWRIIKDAKAMGCTTYDLGGIDDKNPRWTGITRFKRGFGAEEMAFAPSVDVVFRFGFYHCYRHGSVFFSRLASPGGVFGALFFPFCRVSHALY